MQTLHKEQRVKYNTTLKRELLMTPKIVIRGKKGIPRISGKRVVSSKVRDQFG